MGEKLRLLKGGRKKEDVYDKYKKTGHVDIDGEQHSGIPFCDPYEEQAEDDHLRWKAREIVNEITADPIERSIAELMLDYGYTEVEVAEIILSQWKLKGMNESLARVKWFMRKIEAWKKNKPDHKKDS